MRLRTLIAQIRGKGNEIGVNNKHRKAKLWRIGQNYPNSQ